VKAFAATDMHAVSVSAGDVNILLSVGEAQALTLELIAATGEVQQANDYARRHFEYEAAKERHHGRI
jgi:hypothetical protein